MIIANQKRSLNIAEYIIYMWQIEDLIRAYQLDLNRIENELIKQYQASDKLKEEILNWYANLLTMMKEENIEKQGHLGYLRGLVDELNQFHFKLLNDGKEDYKRLYQNAFINIEELKKKNSKEKGEIQVCLEAVYGILLLKLQKKDISKDTSQAIDSISKMLAHLSVKFKDYEEGNMAESS